jgi:hypothetical protein
MSDTPPNIRTVVYLAPHVHETLTFIAAKMAADCGRRASRGDVIEVLMELYLDGSEVAKKRKEKP